MRRRELEGGVPIGDPGAGQHHLRRGDEAVERGPVGRGHDGHLDASGIGIGIGSDIGPIVDHHDLEPAPQQRARHGPAGHPEAHDEEALRAERRRRAHSSIAPDPTKSAEKSPIPSATHSPAMIQNRMITVVSGPPPSSKWWWMGAMRKIRR